MPVDLDQFRERLLSSGLPLPEQVRQFVQSQSFSDSEKLAKALVAQQVLTRYQAQVLLGYRDGPLVLDRYVVESPIGEGGMGQVYRAVHRHIRRTVAVKVLPPSQAARNKKLVQRFYREVRTLARLHHPHIVVAHDAGVHQGALFLVMEYVHGLDLAELVHRHGPLPLVRALEYLEQAALGLRYAHGQGVVHRDVKPRNLLLELPDCSAEELKEPTPDFHLRHRGTVKLLDLGLALWRAGGQHHETDLTQTGEVMGTVDYMSPEQAESTHHVDARSDIYSLGCTFFFLLTGYPPYAGETPIRTILAHRSAPIPSLVQAVKADSPQWAATIASPVLADELLHRAQRLFRRMVAKRAEERFASMDELIEQLRSLRALLGSPGTGAAASTVEGAETETLPAMSTFPELGLEPPKQVPLPEPARAAAERLGWQGSRRVLIAAAAAGAVLLGGGAWWLLRSDSSLGTLVLLGSQPELAGAEVQLDGKTAGRFPPDRRPMRLQLAASDKPVRITVTKPGFRPFSAQVVVPPGRETHLRVRLVPAAVSDNETDKTPALQAEQAATARQIALWIIDKQGAIVVATDRRRLVVRSASALPRQPFRLIAVDLFNNNMARRFQLTDAALAPILPRLSDVEHLDLSYTQVGDRTLKLLVGLKRLKRLRLKMTNVTSRGLEHLLALPELDELDLQGISVTNRGLETLAQLSKLKTLVLRQTPVTDRGVAQLVRLKQLELLDLSETAVSPAVGRVLQNIPSLKQVFLDRNKVDDSLFVSLARLPQLKVLSLVGTNTGDAHLVHMDRFGWLNKLDISETLVTDSGLSHLRGHPRLEHLLVNRAPLAETPRVTDTGLAHVVEIPRLWSLEVAYASVTDQGLSVLPQAEALRQLNLTGVKLRGPGLTFLARLMNLRRLFLARCSFEPKHLALLALARRLVELDLSHTATDDAALQHVGRLKTLERLNLAYTRISDRGLQYLAGLKKLTNLDARGTQVTAEGARQLAKKLPRPCAVFFD